MFLSWSSPEALQEVIHLAGGQVGAEAVPGVVQAHQAEVGTVGHEARGQQVEAACIVQPAVQCQPGPCVLCVLVRGM